MGERFWTAKGVRQGCPMSPALFNLLTADMEEELSEGWWGGIKVGGRKVYSLAYADDVVVLAEGEEEMKRMIKRLEAYFEKKKLEVNVEKTKVLWFRKGGGRRKKTEWKWRGKKIEEVKEFKYLGYVFRRDATQEAHIKDRVKKAGAAMRQVWGIGMRKFGKDWRRRMRLFDTLVWTVVGYGAEIWGVEERREIEAMQERYIRWTLGVDWRTPGYMVREETKRDKIRTRAGRRAWNFEEKLMRGEGSEIARACLEEIKERETREEERSKWERERKKFRGGHRGEGEAGRREQRWESYEQKEKEDKQDQEEERKEKIVKSRYNRWYREIRTEEIPKYLTAGWGEQRCRRVARFRLGNEMREGRYWAVEEERECRMCGEERESWEHVLDRCRGGNGEERGMGERIREILDERGTGERWMNEMENMRKTRVKERDVETDE